MATDADMFTVGSLVAQVRTLRQRVAELEQRPTHPLDGAIDLPRMLSEAQARVAEVEAERDGLASSLSEAATRAGKNVCRTCRMSPDDCDVHGEPTNHATCKRWEKEARRLRAHEEPERRVAICNNDGYELEVPTGSLAIDPCPQCGELQWRFEPPEHDPRSTTDELRRSKLEP